jgi:hypothetical protein
MKQIKNVAVAILTAVISLTLILAFFVKALIIFLIILNEIIDIYIKAIKNSALFNRKYIME